MSNRTSEMSELDPNDYDVLESDEDEILPRTVRAPTPRLPTLPRPPSRVMTNAKRTTPPQPRLASRADPERVAPSPEDTATDWEHVPDEVAVGAAAVAAARPNSRLTSRQRLQSYARRSALVSNAQKRNERKISVTFQNYLAVDPVEDKLSFTFLKDLVNKILEPHLREAYPDIEIDYNPRGRKIKTVIYEWKMTSTETSANIADFIADALKIIANGMNEEQRMLRSFRIDIVVKSGNHTRPVLRRFYSWPMSLNIVKVGGKDVSVVQIYMEARSTGGNVSTCIDALADTMDGLLAGSQKTVVHRYRDDLPMGWLCTWIVQGPLPPRRLDVYVAALKNSGACDNVGTAFRVTLIIEGQGRRAFNYQKRRAMQMGRSSVFV